MSNGIVVDHKESGVRYAVFEEYFNSEVHTKVRDLKPGETVLGYQPVSREALGSTKDTNTPGEAAADPTDLSETASKTPAATPKHTNTK